MSFVLFKFNNTLKTYIIYQGHHHTNRLTQQSSLAQVLHIEVYGGSGYTAPHIFDI